VEKKLAQLLEQEWRSNKGLRLKIDWVPGKPGAYRWIVRKDSGRSLTNHTDKTIAIANYAPLRTLAHELGHVLGFDDHYYDVWHEQYCYYTQEYRRSDLMSDSSSGQVNPRHWELMEAAYPWKKPALSAAFIYTY
jgi:hypothetical protein